MKTLELAYQPFGLGLWNRVTVSKDVAQALAKEYMSYGWLVELDGEALNPQQELKAA